MSIYFKKKRAILLFKYGIHCVNTYERLVTLLSLFTLFTEYSANDWVIKRSMHLTNAFSERMVFQLKCKANSY